MQIRMHAEERERLLSLIRDTPGVIRRGEFTLSSGGKSNVRFDIDKIMTIPDGIGYVATAFLRTLASLDPQIRKVGGKADGAVPIITAMVQDSQKFSLDLEGFWVSKDGKKVSGTYPEDEVYLGVDDVLTTGKSIITVKLATRQYNAAPAAVFAVIDRGAEATFEIMGIPYYYMFTEGEVLDSSDTSAPK